MRYRIIIAILLITILVLGCMNKEIKCIMEEALSGGYSKKDFHICMNFGCKNKIKLSFSKDEWNMILSLFSRPYEDAQSERHRIAEAIGEMEKIVSKKIHISQRLISWKILFNSEWNQMDCIDETFNTITYLKLLEKEGILKFHRISGVAYRGYFLDCLPHYCATITELGSGKRFAVDSYFYGNGSPPAILPLDLWLSCWYPKGDNRNGEQK